MIPRMFILDDRANRLLLAFGCSQYEFRTLENLSKELDMTPSDILSIMSGYGFLFTQSHKDPTKFGISDRILRMMAPIPEEVQMKKVSLEEMLAHNSE